ncbi:hypothetical protein ASC77_24665 [Nocardioides sp. Root1257]|uniref:hypothetical protein n=1 Tax=unclassified Nocardioides TaxID=2615069 RepID=UPI0006F6CC68|nr:MULTISPECIES: hypothetical protein [unclassified Nocardioides]KQW52564.1 hypothetical protein ASC77_24665 [Nocardioides sp. Root1257]KRC54627.1 hypothetical protein ASE24_24455 [Nocardioides sp. Root224]
MSAREPLRGVPASVEQATHAVASAAAKLGLDLSSHDAMSLATAALTSFDLLVVVEDETSVGMWSVQETRDALRRRLRDRAAVQALDEGYAIIACQSESVVGLGSVGETLPLTEAASAVVTHTYQARFLLRGSAPRLDEDDGERNEPGASTCVPEKTYGPLRPV